MICPSKHLLTRSLQVRSIRRAFRILKSGDISQQDWQPGQLLCCSYPHSVYTDDLPANSVRLEAVLIDFAYASQTEVGTHCKSEDFHNLRASFNVTSAGLREHVLQEAWEPESEELDYGAYPV